MEIPPVLILRVREPELQGLAFSNKIFPVKNTHSKSKAAFIVWILASVFFHAIFFVPLLFWLINSDDTFSDLDKISISLWTQNPDTKTPEEELIEYKPEKEIPKGQVVSVKKIKEKIEKKIDPVFLAEHESRVKIQTRNRNYDSSFNLKDALARDLLFTDKFKLNLNKQSQILKNLNSKDAFFTNDQNKKTGKIQISIKPSHQAMASATADDGLNHLEDVIDADKTALNTSMWQYAGFFNRVKSKVKRYWHPEREYLVRDPYGNIYGTKDRKTVLLVVLDNSGELAKLYVMEPSGAGFLDDEAFSAVKNASPFGNVPKGLKDKRDGLVKFTFHFTVEVGGSPVVRMRRY